MNQNKTTIKCVLIKCFQNIISYLQVFIQKPNWRTNINDIDSANQAWGIVSRDGNLEILISCPSIDWFIKLGNKTVKEKY